MEKFKVTFFPDNKSVFVEKDKTVLSAAISAGIYISSACGGDGVCGRCKVILKKGQVSEQPNGIITEKERKNNIYLACLTNIRGELEIEIPESSRLEFDRIAGKNEPEDLYSRAESIHYPVAEFNEKVFKYSPCVNKVYLEM
ncbi:MAG: 2Fe-2S iron-sulfur cluster-binding protein, partial [Candidatus Omnitrophica bacterium]|nr:2Fe-2S iron-sulfur cluster-binding protein [Candidatus Omnitrophota bacterium]